MSEMPFISLACLVIGIIVLWLASRALPDPDHVWRALESDEFETGDFDDATAVKYGLIAGLISVVIATILTL